MRKKNNNNNNTYFVSLLFLVLPLLSFFACLVNPVTLDPEGDLDLFIKHVQEKKSSLASAGTEEEKVPNIVHFVFGLLDKPSFELHHFLAVASVAEVQKPDAIYFWYYHLPLDGLYWRSASRFLTMKKLKMIPSKVYGNPIENFAHVTDVLRLMILYEFGGVYLDVDVVMLKSINYPLSDYRSKKTVLGREGTALTPVGLCNAVIISQPGTQFLRRWLQEYRSFNDSEWNQHSVILPLRIAEELGSNEIHVVDYYKFFWPLWDKRGLRELFIMKSFDLSSNYFVHLWETNSRNVFLRHITPEIIMTVDTPLFCKCRKWLRNLLTEEGSSHFKIGIEEVEENPNCTIAHINSNEYGVVGFWRFDDISLDGKLVDSLTNQLHGWALAGTSFESGTSQRRVVSDSVLVFEASSAYSIATLPAGNRIVTTDTGFSAGGWIQASPTLREAHSQHLPIFTLQLSTFSISLFLLPIPENTGDAHLCVSIPEFEKEQVVTRDPILQLGEWHLVFITGTPTPSGLSLDVILGYHSVLDSPIVLPILQDVVWLDVIWLGSLSLDRKVDTPTFKGRMNDFVLFDRPILESELYFISQMEPSQMNAAQVLLQSLPLGLTIKYNFSSGMTAQGSILRVPDSGSLGAFHSEFVGVDLQNDILQRKQGMTSQPGRRIRLSHSSPITSYLRPMIVSRVAFEFTCSVLHWEKHRDTSFRWLLLRIRIQEVEALFSVGFQAITIDTKPHLVPAVFLSLEGKEEELLLIPDDFTICVYSTKETLKVTFQVEPFFVVLQCNDITTGRSLFIPHRFTVGLSGFTVESVVLQIHSDDDFWLSVNLISLLINQHIQSFEFRHGAMPFYNTIAEEDSYSFSSSPSPSSPSSYLSLLFLLALNSLPLFIFSGVFKSLRISRVIKVGAIVVLILINSTSIYLHYKLPSSSALHSFGRNVTTHDVKTEVTSPLLVSVVIPCFQQAQYLPLAVKSVLSQSYHHWEVVIVDDASPDHCFQAGQRLQREFPSADIKVIRKQVNSGLSDSRNKAISESKGTWICLLDADDFIHRNYLKLGIGQILQAWQTSRRDSGTFTLSTIHDDPSFVIAVTAYQQFFQDSHWSWRLPSFSKSRILYEGIFPVPTLFRKLDWQRTGGFSTILPLGNEDWSFWIALSHLPGFQVHVLKDFLLFYRYKQESMQRKKEQYEQEIRAFMKTLHPDLYSISELLEAHEMISSASEQLKDVVLGRVAQFPNEINSKLWQGLFSFSNRSRAIGLYEEGISWQKGREGKKRMDWQLFYLSGRNSEAALLCPPLYSNQTTDLYCPCSGCK